MPKLYQILHPFLRCATNNLMEAESYPQTHRRLIIPTTIGPDENEVIAKALGVWIWNEEGKKYFEASSQVSTANIGHNHPKFVRWMQEFWKAAGQGEVVTTFMGTDGFYRNHWKNLKVDGVMMELSPAALCDRLAPHIFGLNKTHFGVHITGGQANNIGIRYMQEITGKPYWISFEKSFNGRDGESLDSSDSNPAHFGIKKRSGDVYLLPYPETIQDFEFCLEKLNGIPLSKCACVIYEPVQGEGGGMRVGHYLKDLEQILKKEGIYSVSDEVQAGLGRCGEWFSYQALGLDPDAIVLGKSLGAGHPISIVGFKDELKQVGVFPANRVSGTFTMSPVGIAAANFVMRIYEEEKIVENARKLSPKFGMLLKKSIKPYGDASFSSKLPVLRVDGIGLYRSIKFYDKDSQPDPETRNLVNLKLRELGVWTYPASKSFPAIRLTPPLISSLQDLEFLKDAIYQATRGIQTDESTHDLTT